MTAHTPGPWLYRHKNDGVYTAPPEGTSYSYGELIFAFNEDFSPPSSDLPLILAAPDLLEALEKAELHLAAIGTPRDAQGRYHKDGEWTFGEALPRDADAREVSAAFALVRAAIAKAKGESDGR